MKRMSKRIEFNLNVYDFAIIILSLIGLLSMSYLYAYSAQISSGQNTSCSISGTPFNCGNVINSNYSHLFGIPLYYYGIVLFSVFLALGLTATISRGRKELAFVDSIIFGLAVLSSAAAVYLIAVEVFLIGKICEMCTISHASIFLILFVSFMWIKKRFK